MNTKVLHTLEFDKIIEKLADKATCEPGANLCCQLLPVNDQSEMEAAQKDTAAAFSRLVKWGNISFSGATDLRPSIMRLGLGSSLNIVEIMQVASLLEVTKRAHVYGKQQEEVDCLTDIFLGLDPQLPLLNEIRRCIIDEETIADDASPALQEIRRGMARTNDQIKSKMNQMLNNTSTRSYLSEPVITIRQGRYCLPVRADSKSRVPGMVHDQSGSGTTFFIEPMAVVDLNNEMRELQVREQDEIERILANLSNRIAEADENIIHNFDLLVELDFIFAKGQLAVEMNGSVPVFNNEGIINLRGARHPLIAKDKVVPVDLRLGEDYNLLLITGPNTGGKTVSLKTCGLFTLMAQAGLHIPAKDRSQIAIFDDVFADIGDEQSIEQSLSTFSSHMTNMRILNAIEEGSAEAGAQGRQAQYLCLFDELCAGTDPKEGAAIATSILDRLHKLDVRTMATTHYSELKVYAITTSGVENGCCEFSLETLSPTYHLIIGLPGKSNAFAISKKLGLDESILNDAGQRINEDDKSFEDLMIELETKKRQIEDDRIAIAKEKEEIDKKLADVTNRQAALTERKDRILREANEEAADILQKAKELADSTIRDFNKDGVGHGNIKDMEARRAALGKEVNKARGANRQEKPKENTNIPKELHMGDKVKVLSMNLTGTVCSLPNAKGDLTVLMGIMKSNVNIKDLVLIVEEHPFAPKKGQTKKSAGMGGFNKAATISPEINLLGCTVDEAIARLEKYLDDAYISHLSSVRVVHGKGTGALRKGVQQYLKRHPSVAEFHQAEFGEGDAGVTIVEFK